MKAKTGLILIHLLLIMVLLTGCSAASSNSAVTTDTNTTTSSTSSESDTDTSTDEVAAETTSEEVASAETIDEMAPPDGEMPEGTPPDGTPPDGAPGEGGMPGGGSQEVDTGTGAYVLSDDETINGDTYTSTADDENAIRAEDEITATLNNVTVEKTDGSASSSDASSFYGLNAAILALDTATLNINGGTVTATSEGSNGVFAYDGATIYIEDTIIDVSGGNAGGIEVAGGGTMYATNLTVNSVVKAAIRSDRGGGTLIVDGGTYTTTGSSGAPAVYSTADIIVSNATLTANDSEAVVVEGFNSVTIIDSDVTGNMSGTYGNENGDNVQNIMLYQSMSGDAEIGTSSFTMSGGSLTSLNGDMFYVTNTNSIISLSDVDLTLADGTYLLRVSGNNSSRGWGTSGENGGTAEFNVNEQTLTGDIFVDEISSLTINFTESSYTGAINSEGTAAASLLVNLDENSSWTLTADSYITEFSGSLNNVISNGYTLYVNGNAMN